MLRKHIIIIVIITQMSVFLEGEHAQRPKFGKKNFIRHFARFNFSRLSLAFTSKYYPILIVMKR